MSAEYKYCPKCHIINSPNATKCECGHDFSVAGGLTESELNDAIKAKKRKKSIIAAVTYAAIAVFVILAIRFGIGFVLVALFYALVLFLVSTLIFGLIARYQRKHPKE